jgi:histone H1/5
MTTEEKPAKPAKAAHPKTKKPRTHPKYEKMIAEAIVDSKSRTGISRQAIKKYIQHKYPTIPENILAVQLRLQLRRLVANGHLIQTKGSYRLSQNVKAKITKGRKTRKPRVKSAEGQKPRKKKAPAEGGVKKKTKKASTKAAKKAAPKKSKKAAAKESGESMKTEGEASTSAEAEKKEESSEEKKEVKEEVKEEAAKKSPKHKKSPKKSPKKAVTPKKATPKK